MQSHSIPAERVSGARKKVLIVDNQELGRRLLMYTLRNHFDLLETERGAEAIAMAQQEQPDLMLLDIEMPDMNGIEVCKQVRSDARTRNIIVFIVTAFDTDDNRASAIAAGADAFVAKPFSPVALRQMIIDRLR